MNTEYFLFPNKTELVFQNVKSILSFSVGVYVKVGSRQEIKEERGYSHFVEHLLFKSTQNRSSKDIVLAIERVGGNINAYTTQEYTCFYITVNKNYREISFDILSDMLFFPKFVPKELEKEKQVILEEMKQCEDAPDEYIHDLFLKNIFYKHSLGYPIIGNKESISNTNSESIKKFYQKYYNPDNFLISVVGDIEFSECKKLVEQYFVKTTQTKTYIKKNNTPTKNFSTFKESRKLEQIYFLIGAEGFPKDFPTNIKIACLNYIIGGSMSSRLFQKIREELGFCYNIGTSYLSYTDVGSFSIYCSTSKDKFQSCISEIYKQIQLLLKEGISNKEFEDSISHNIGFLSISSQLTESKMNNNAIYQMFYNKIFTLEEQIKEFKKVHIQDLNSLSKKIFDISSFHLSCLGDIQ